MGIIDITDEEAVATVMKVKDMAVQFREVVKQREQLREALDGLLSSHEDLTNWAEDPSIGRPDIEWSLEFAKAARTALNATE